MNQHGNLLGIIVSILFSSMAYANKYAIEYQFFMDRPGRPADRNVPFEIADVDFEDRNNLIVGSLVLVRELDGVKLKAQLDIWSLFYSKFMGSGIEIRLFSNDKRSSTSLVQFPLLLSPIVGSTSQNVLLEGGEVRIGDSSGIPAFAVRIFTKTQ